MGSKEHPGTFDCYAHARPREPMFILVARDAGAPALVRAWADRREAAGEDPAKVAEARKCATDMEDWRTIHRPPIEHADMCEARGGFGDFAPCTCGNRQAWDARSEAMLRRPDLIEEVTWWQYASDHKECPSCHLQLRFHTRRRDGQKRTVGVVCPPPFTTPPEFR